MSRKETKEVGSFIAIDSEGGEYRIHIFQDFHISSTRGGTQRVPGHKSLKTSDGKHVNHLSQGNYETVSAGIALTSDDPTAP